VPYDVLVIGSGASGLAAAVAAERAGARVAVATKGSLQSCNSAKAQGGIQAAFGEQDSPEIHADDIWNSSHETADPRRRVHARQRRLSARSLRRRDAEAPAPGRRPNRARDHEGAA
jgi:succinate dehydrogenase/fumarate reductase flavoprotein subunit